MKSSRLIFIFILLFSTTGYCQVLDMGVFGNTYAITEKDALTELETLSNGLTIQDFINKEEAEKKIKAFRPETTALPKAKEDREYLVDMTYTLEFDIPDQHGNIIYPKGYRFNPLEYYKNSKTYVVIDGDDKEQIKWYKASPYFNKLNAILMITQGSYADLTEELKRPVFYALKSVTEKFQLEYVPSIIWQDGKHMRVKEIKCPSLKIEEKR